MQSETLLILPIVGGAVIGLALLLIGLWLARGTAARAKEQADKLVAESEHDAESRKKQILLAAHEKSLAQQDEFDRQERELLERENKLENRSRELDGRSSELDRDRDRLQRQGKEIERRMRAAEESETEANGMREEARANLERIAGMTAKQAQSELIDGIKREATAEANRLAKKIEDQARENAEREAVQMMVRASQRVNIRDVLESTVSFIELPSDEMKGRIIGREGRNIRSLEMATGIDLVVDDTPRSILISSFDPIRRHVARVAIHRLVEDGRIHPARIEEVVQKVREELDTMIEDHGTETAYGLGISDLHPRLIRLVGKMRYHTYHGQHLLQHCLETAIVAGHMANEVGANEDVVRRAGLLHEIGQTDPGASTHPILAAAELAGRYGETEEVVRAIRGLHTDVEANTMEAILVHAANRMSENRPGARKENLAVFIERLKRLEGIATGFAGVDRAYAVKAGKEVRVILDAEQADDQSAHRLCKQIARTLERELSYPGQIKVSVIRETRAIQFAI
ncbi:MAG: ribonuclease Y [bacterium]|nr:ribonuclease Y [bacterium]